MAELSNADVVAYTNGRLADDAETTRMLAAALSAARREAGWHVSPVVTETVGLDGPNSRMLRLPTRKVVELIEITEDDVTVDLSTVRVSAGSMPGRGRPVAVRKVSDGWWSANYDAIVVEMEHGYTEAEAASWRQGILSMVDQMSTVPINAGTGVSDMAQRGWRVDDVQVSYAPFTALAEDVLFSVSHIMCDYKLPGVEFM